MSAEVLSERFEMRLGASVLQSVDAWRIRQEDLPSRAEAIRRLIDAGLTATSPAKKEVRLTDGEKLILLALRDQSRHFKVKDAEIDLDFVADTIAGGHSWGLEWRFEGMFHHKEDSKAAVSEVVNILDMWSVLDLRMQEVSKKDKGRIAAECAPLDADFRFRGFDGNNEEGLLGIARFLIDHLGRFTNFEGRELNSHSRTIDSYRRMLMVYEPIRNSLVGRKLSTDEVIRILNAWLAPRKR